MPVIFIAGKKYRVAHTNQSIVAEKIAKALLMDNYYNERVRFYHRSLFCLLHLKEGLQ